MPAPTKMTTCQSSTFYNHLEFSDRAISKPLKITKKIILYIRHSQTTISSLFQQKCTHANQVPSTTVSSLSDRAVGGLLTWAECRDATLADFCRPINHLPKINDAVHCWKHDSLNTGKLPRKFSCYYNFTKTFSLNLIQSPWITV